MKSSKEIVTSQAPIGPLVAQIGQCQPIAYLDTAQVWIPGPLPPSKLRRLMLYCQRVTQFRLHKKLRGRWQYRLLFQRPDRNALQKFEKFTAGRYLINRVEIALDLLVSTKAEASALEAHLLKHVVQKWHGDRKVTRFKHTTYWSSDGWTARNFALYADRPSKMTGEPCAHLELRIRRAAACRRASIKTMSDLINLDARALWDNELRIKSISKETLDRAIEKLAGEGIRQRHPAKTIKWLGLQISSRQHQKRQIRGTLAAAAQTHEQKFEGNELHFYSSQRILEVAPWLRRRFKKQPHGDLLPSSALVNL